MDIMIYKKKWPAFFFLFPAMLFMLVFLYYPFVMNIINSFFNTTALGAPMEGFIGLENYTKLFSDPLIGVSFWNTLLMMICTIVFQVGIALILSLMVDVVGKGAGFFRTLYFFPIVVSATALGLIFNLLFAYDGGAVNQIIQAFGGESIIWKEEHVFFTMALPVMWQYVGYYFVIIATGLNNISNDINEAAAIDGAIGLKRVRYITLPLIHNTLVTCLTLAITGALKVFDLPWTMFPMGVPSGQSFLTGSYMYYQTFNRGDVDYGATIAFLIVLLGVALSMITKVVLKEKDY